MKKENGNLSSSLLGGKTMKKTLFVLAAVALLVFAFAAVAGAKYAGSFVYGQNTPTNPNDVKDPNVYGMGYLSWGSADTTSGAQGLMKVNLIAPNPAGTSTTKADLMGTAHGGYVTTTTKCAVCHSVHRALGSSTTSSAGVYSVNAGTVNNQLLTMGGNTCQQCHTAWGATPVTMLVEWAQPQDGAAGPHNSSGCLNCHKGGIHGDATSQYWAMNAFLLGGANDFGTGTSVATASAGSIAKELPYQVGRAAQGGTEFISDTANGSSVYTNGTGTGTEWFINGSSSQTAMGPGVGTGAPSGLTIGQWTAARSLLTGFTCSQPGCHINSVFGNIVWGQTYSRAQGALNGANDAGAPMLATTGHSTAFGANSSHSATCGPCHSGDYAGGYRYGGGLPTNVVNSNPLIPSQSNAATYYLNNPYGLPTSSYALTNSQAVGCDQCHDAVGQATNSTAFPHGNRAINIYQWTLARGAAAGTPTDVVFAASGNIWMYQSNMSGSNSTSTNAVDPSYTLLQGTVSGKGPSASGIPGNIEDAVCLKCHVPYDSLSAAAWGLPAGTYLSASTHGRPSAAVAAMLVNYTSTVASKYAAAASVPVNALYTGSPASGTAFWIYLWK